MHWIKVNICDSIMASELPYRRGLVLAEDIQVIRPLEGGVTALVLRHLQTPVFVSEEVEEIEELLASCARSQSVLRISDEDI
jgi:hypothetical protein